jgi:hypothetical protein
MDEQLPRQFGRTRTLGERLLELILLGLCAIPFLLIGLASLVAGVIFIGICFSALAGIVIVCSLMRFRQSGFTGVTLEANGMVLRNAFLFGERGREWFIKFADVRSVIETVDEVILKTGEGTAHLDYLLLGGTTATRQFMDALVPNLPKACDVKVVPKSLIRVWAARERRK